MTARSVEAVPPTIVAFAFVPSLKVTMTEVASATT